jgi:hypothetical protein
MNSKQSIAELAYRLWNERGRPHDSADDDWLEAERQLAQQVRDPATGHVPEPPSANAAEKVVAASNRPQSKPKSPKKLAGRPADSPPANKH